MKFSPANMKAARDLTRSGKLVEATALIQQMLSGQGAARAPTSGTAAWPDVGGPTAASKMKLARRADARPEEGQPIPVGPFAQGATYWENKQYVGDAGQRSYKIFVPSHYAGEPMPLVMMLHGCTQTPDDFAAGTQMNALGEEIGFLVAYPAQPASANSNACWNWFSPADQQKSKGEPAIIAGIVAEIAGNYAVDTSRVYVAGLSAGGAMAAVLGVTYPEVFAAIGVHSGLPCGAAKDIISAFKAMKRGAGQGISGLAAQSVPTIVFHGERDRTVNPVNADNVLDQFDLTRAMANYKTTFETSSGGMEYSKSVQVNDSGKPMFEKWLVHRAGHAWSGGSAQGSYTEPRGPDASREMIRFFLHHRIAP